MNKKSELAKIGQAYFIIIVSVICFTGIICGGVMARNNTRALSIGEQEARLALSHSEKSLSITVEEKKLAVLPGTAEKLAQIAGVTPAPFSSIVWAAESIVEIVKPDK